MHKILTVMFLLPMKKSSLGQTGELISNWPKIAISAKEINLDSKTCFGYPDGYCLR
jgi:hypothetical protein